MAGEALRGAGEVMAQALRQQKAEAIIVGGSPAEPL